MSIWTAFVEIGKKTYSLKVFLDAFLAIIRDGPQCVKYARTYHQENAVAAVLYR